MLEDTVGHRYPVKQVLAVPKNSEEYKLPEELFPNAARRGVQKEALKGYADEIKEKIRGAKDHQLSFARVVQFLKDKPGIDDTMDVQRIPMVGRWVKFLRLFQFEIQGVGPAMVVKLPKPRAPGASSSGASSSTAAEAPQEPPAAAPATAPQRKTISLLLDRMKARQAAKASSSGASSSAAPPKAPVQKHRCRHHQKYYQNHQKARKWPPLTYLEGRC